MFLNMTGVVVKVGLLYQNGLTQCDQLKKVSSNAKSGSYLTAARVQPFEFHHVLHIIETESCHCCLPIFV